MTRTGLPGGYRLIRRERVGSTNDEAKRLARAGADHGTVVLAREQTDGRGRYGRGWVSPPGNLYCSLVLVPGCGAAAAGQLGFVAALAAADALEAHLPAGAALRYKWPNDLLLNNRKLAGILLETNGSGGAGGELDWLVLGVGVNLIGHPEEPGYPATSVAAAGGAAPDALAAAQGFVAAFDRRWRSWKATGFAPVRTAWIARARGLGEPIEVRLADRTFSGTFAALDETGALILEQADGRRRVIAAGDVFFSSDPYPRV